MARRAACALGYIFLFVLQQFTYAIETAEKNNWEEVEPVALLRWEVEQYMRILDRKFYKTLIHLIDNIGPTQREKVNNLLKEKEAEIEQKWKLLATSSGLNVEQISYFGLKRAAYVEHMKKRSDVPTLPVQKFLDALYAAAPPRTGVDQHSSKHNEKHTMDWYKLFEGINYKHRHSSSEKRYHDPPEGRLWKEQRKPYPEVAAGVMSYHISEINCGIDDLGSDAGDLGNTLSPLSNFCSYVHYVGYCVSCIYK